MTAVIKQGKSGINFGDQVVQFAQPQTVVSYLKAHIDIGNGYQRTAVILTRFSRSDEMKQIDATFRKLM